MRSIKLTIGRAGRGRRAGASARGCAGRARGTPGAHHRAASAACASPSNPHMCTSGEAVLLTGDARLRPGAPAANRP